MAACAEFYKTVSCESINAGELPDCVTPGTRQVGEACRFPSQCASLMCKLEGAVCGVCATQGAPGDDCSALEAGCAPNAYCDDATSTCVAVPVSSGTGGTAHVKGPGEICEPNDCITDYHCAYSELVGDKVCTPYPTLGQSCSSERSCDSSSYCELDGLLCEARPAEGEPCGVDVFTGKATWCANGLVCDLDTATVGTCVKPPRTGEPCLVNPETGAPLPRCEEGAICDTTATPATCKAPAALGEACSMAVGCEQDASCQCTEDGCTTPVCMHMRIGGESCDSTTSKCLPGYACVAGVCEAVTSQGLFEAACAN